MPSGVDPDYILDFARTHEEAGFDMVLTGYSSSTPDGFEVAGYAAAHTERLGYLIAHRPRLRRAHARGQKGGHAGPVGPTGESPCTSSPGATTSSSGRTATGWITTRATGARTNTWT